LSLKSWFEKFSSEKDSKAAFGGLGLPVDVVLAGVLLLVLDWGFGDGARWVPESLVVRLQSLYTWWLVVFRVFAFRCLVRRGVFLSSGLKFRLSNLKPELSILLGKRLLDDVQCVRRLTYLTFKH